MAFTTKLFSFVFLVTLLSFQIQVHARESQFFSKFTNNNVKESEFPTKEESVKYKQEEQEPTFIPQTTQAGYGLYGHETTESSPATTTYNGVHYATTTTPTTTTPTSYEPYTTTPTSFEPYKTTPTTTTPSSFEPYKTTTSYEPYTTPTTTKPTSFEAYNENNYYNNNNGGNKYNVERQGMSDTRFLENGRYYHDINSEKNYYQNNNQYGNTKVVDQKNWYNNRGGYVGNNNNRNSYVPNSNSFEGYQNQEQFQENDEVFDP